MKADDRTMTLLTGVVLTIAVGSLAQNSDTIMAMFSGEVKTPTAADSFTVKAGKVQVLDVLANDPAADKAKEIRLVSPPACGSVQAVGRDFQFSDTATCAGVVTFEYCLALDEVCDSTTVTLNVIGTPAPRKEEAVIAEIQQTPPKAEPTQPRIAEVTPPAPEPAEVTPPAPVTAETEPAPSQPEDVDDIRLAVLSALKRPPVAAQPQATPTTTAQTPQADVPAEPVTVPRPAPSETVAQIPPEPVTTVAPTQKRTFKEAEPAPVSAIASVIDPLPEPAMEEIELAVTIPAAPVAPDESAESNKEDIPAVTAIARAANPDFGIDTAAQIMLPTTQSKIGNRAAAASHQIETASLQTDTSFTTTTVAELAETPPAEVETAALAPSAEPLPAPESTVQPQAAELCSASIDLSLAAGATVDAAINASCHPGEMISVEHAGIRFSAKTDAGGNALVHVPAMSSDARISVQFADGSALDAETTVPGMDHYMRVAVTWDAAADLDLHAREFGANTGELGHVWSGMARSYRDARRFGGGYLTTLGLGSGEGPQAEVYTLPLLRRADNGLVEMSLALGGGAACAEDLMIRAVRSDTSHTARIRELRFNVADCDRRSEPVFIAYALEDLRVASRR